MAPEGPSLTFLFLLLVSPIIVTSVGQVSCRIGASAVLPCRAVGILPITYTWTRARAETQSAISPSEDRHIDGEQQYWNYFQQQTQIPEKEGNSCNVCLVLLLYRGWSSAHFNCAVVWSRRILLYCWEPSRTTSETNHPHCHRCFYIDSLLSCHFFHI